MKALAYLLPVFMSISTFALAASVACPGKIDHVDVEQGHNKPYPDSIPPDVGEYGETPQQEWNFLPGRPQDISITVHCFPTKGKTVGADIDVPNRIKKCTFLKNRFWCE